MSGQGRFTWYDLMTTDPAAAESFYTELIGWTTSDWDGPAPYRMWTQGDAPLGGIMELSEEARSAGAPPHWIAYVAVDDIDATVEKAVSLGADVMVPPQEIPDTGRFAVLADPDGAAFAVYTSAGEETSDDEPPGVGHFSWHELAAVDHPTSAGFYGALFGWEKGDLHDMGEGMGTYQLFSRRVGTSLIVGMFNKPDDMPAAWILYIRVPDTDAAVERVRQLGGQVVNGPMEVPGGVRIAQCIDPQGAFFALKSTAS